MDHLHALVRQVRWQLFVLLLVNGGLVGGAWWLSSNVYHLKSLYIMGAVGGTAILSSIALSLVSAEHFVTPVRMLWQAVLHVAPDATNVSAPKPEKAHLGRELVTNLTAQIYQLAMNAEQMTAHMGKAAHDLQANALAQLLPLPLIVLAKDQTIAFVNEPAEQYLKLAAADIVGKNVYDVLDLSFPSDNTLETWLTRVQGSSVTASENWERVRLKLRDPDSTLRQFDLAARYNKDNPDGYETVLAVFDHTNRYGQDDQALSFVALAVHELRTPLTLLRGYIEALGEELEDRATPELTDFMHKMDASAQQLTIFVNNILNVARIEADQLSLQLHEAAWADIVTAVVHDMNLRAQVNGITIEATVTNDLPPVAVDRVSIYEVLANLLDNAIKYSGDSKQILVKSSLTNDGLVETTVQDFGVGIPEGVMPHLFTKYYRDYRQRSRIGGTGLGLYLCKTIVTAHGGNVWVRSKPGEGAIFGFTVLPYAKLADELKNQDNSGITRSAHGWIKNHSLYRR